MPNEQGKSKVAQLEELINQAAHILGEREYGLRPSMFRIYLDPDLTVDFRAIPGPTVQLYISATPFDNHFKTVVRDALKYVERLHRPVEIVLASYYKDQKNHVKKLLKDVPWEPSYRIEESRVRYSTTYITTVEASDAGTGIKVTVTGVQEGEWALKQRAWNELSMAVKEYHEKIKDDPEDNE